MAIFGWLQRYILLFLSWIGIINTDTISWDDLSTQLELLKGEITQSSYFSANDKEIQTLPIDSFVCFPKHLWMRLNRRQFTVIDDVLYSSQQAHIGRIEDYSVDSNIYESSNLVTFSKLERNFNSTDFIASQGLELYGLKVIKYGDYYYGRTYRYSLNEDRSYGKWDQALYDKEYLGLVRRENLAAICVCQTLFGDKLVQLMDTGDSNKGLYVNGNKENWNIPYFIRGSIEFAYQSFFDKLTGVHSFYNALPFSIETTTQQWHPNFSTSLLSPYRRYDMSAGNYLYIMNNDLLYQYDTNIVLQNIYHVPFLNYGTFYMNGSLYFRVKTGAVKCSLT